MAFSFDDAWDNGPEVTRAGTAAFGLYCRCGAWSARNLMDGYVPAEIAAAYGTPEWAKKLVGAGLWEIAEGGYRAPHFLDRNESRDKVLRRRQADADRKARWREKHAQSREESEESHGVTPPGVRSSFTPPKGGKGARSRDAHSSTGLSTGSSTGRTVSEALATGQCPHGSPQAVACALCRRNIPAEEVG